MVSSSGFEEEDDVKGFDDDRKGVDGFVLEARSRLCSVLFRLPESRAEVSPEASVRASTLRRAAAVDCLWLLSVLEMTLLCEVALVIWSESLIVLRRGVFAR